MTCGACKFYAADTSGNHGLCHGLPPSSHIWINGNGDQIWETARPWVAVGDRACSLFTPAIKDEPS